jgi:hypothetical protein
VVEASSSEDIVDVDTEPTFSLFLFLTASVPSDLVPAVSALLDPVVFLQLGSTR